MSYWSSFAKSARAARGKATGLVRLRVARLLYGICRWMSHVQVYLSGMYALHEAAAVCRRARRRYGLELERRRDFAAVGGGESALPLGLSRDS